jgi:hypothetical protein
MLLERTPLPFLLWLLALGTAGSGLTACHRGNAAPPEVSDGGSLATGAGGISPQILQSSLAVATRSMGFAVYSAAPIPPTVVKEAQDAAKEQFPGVNILLLPMDAPLPQALIFAPNIAQFAPPTEQQLTVFGRGLDDAQRHAAAESKGVILLGWKIDADPRLDHLRDAQRLAFDVAQKTSGLVWDETTSQLFALATWKRTRIEGWEGTIPDMRQHISLHVTTNGAQHRTVTLGMVKFGLPDLVLEDVALSDGDRMTKLVEAVAQLLVEGQSPGTSGDLAVDLKAIRHTGARSALIGAAGKDAELHGKVALVTVAEIPGDPQNRLMEMRFANAGKTDAERLSIALTEMLGAPRAQGER